MVLPEEGLKAIGTWLGSAALIIPFHCNLGGGEVDPLNDIYTQEIRNKYLIPDILMISSQPFNLTFFNLQPTVSGDLGHGGVLPGFPQGDTWWVSGLVTGDAGGSAVAHARVL